MKRKKLLVISILLLLTFNILAALNLGTIPASAADYPSVYVDPESTIDPGLTPGDNYTVSIMTDYTGSDITSYQFTLSYNPTVLHGFSVENGDIIGPPAFYFFEPGDFDNTAGKLSLTGAFYFGEDVAPGPGTLATVTFEVAGTGESNITLGIETQLIGWDGVGVYYIVNAITMPTHIGHGYFSNAPPAVEYNLTIAVDGSGSTVPAVGIHTYDEDTLVPVTATADGGWTFDHWVLDTVDVGDTNPYNVLMNADHDLTAFFTEDVGDITPPTITINEPVAKDYLHSETLTLDFSAEDPSPPVSITATLDGEPVMNGDEIELYNLTLGSHIFQVTAVDGFGNSATETVPFEVIATVGSLQDLVTMFFESGIFHSPKGMYTSFIKKLYAAEAYIDAGKISAAKGVLGAFINLAEAKKNTGKLEVWAANILIADAEHIINNL